VLAQRRQRRPILGAAQDDEIGVAIEARKLPQQVPDVGADAEVVQLAGVYANPHAGDDISGPSPDNRADTVAAPSVARPETRPPCAPLLRSSSPGYALRGRSPAGS